MKIAQEIKVSIHLLISDIIHLSIKIKRRIWNKHILLWWYRLWIRKDEFHLSLNMDILAMYEMTKAEQEKYLEDLYHRRHLAHTKDL